MTVHTGREESARFTATAPPVRLEHGPDFYAPPCSRPPKKTVGCVGLGVGGPRRHLGARSGLGGSPHPPRELTLADDGTVGQRPARELLALRGERVLHRTGHVTRSGPVDLGQVSRTFDLTAVLIPSHRLVWSAPGHLRGRRRIPRHGP